MFSKYSKSGLARILFFNCIFQFTLYMSQSILFTPKKLGKLTVPNRFMRSATWEALSDRDGRPPKELLQMIEDLASNNVGLIIPGAVYVTRRGQGMVGESGMTTLEHARKWKPCIEKVHQHGSKLIFQLIHNGLDANPDLNGGYPASGPTSFNKNQHELTNTEIEDLIQNFADSAELAYRASADGAQIHGAHLYLLSSFLSPGLNHRTDKWGGSDENRLRIVKEIISAIRQRVPEDFSLSIKLNGDDYIEGGIKPELCAKYVDMLKDDLDFFEISAGSHHTILSTWNKNILTRGIKDAKRKEDLIQFAKNFTQGQKFHENYNLEALRVIRRKVPSANLALVGGMRKLSTMEKIVNDGDADMISMSRPFLYEPDLVTKFKEGKSDHALCISCGSCILDTSKGVYCHIIKK